MINMNNARNYMKASNIIKVAMHVCMGQQKNISEDFGTEKTLNKRLNPSLGF